VIDGKLDDEVWENATFTYLYDFLASTKEARVKADPATTFAISADDKQLYVAFRCQDTNVSKLRKNVTTRDGKIWNGDNVEIFLNFDRPGHTFRRVMLGASGAVFDAAYLQYGLKEHRWFDIKGLAGATNIQTDHWTGEIAIPFAGLAMKSDATGKEGAIPKSTYIMTLLKVRLCMPSSTSLLVSSPARDGLALSPITQRRNMVSRPLKAGPTVIL
jgi:hypothetical protein